MFIEYKRYSNNTHVSKRAYQGSAGYNLWAGERKILKPQSRELIRLDFNIAIPEEYYGTIVGHSGLANIYGITVHNGTIDSNY